MNKNFRLLILVFISFLSLFVFRLDAEEEPVLSNPDATISMDFKDANIKDILKVLSIQSGLNFIASESVQDRKITLYLDKVPLEQAMNKLFKANNLSYELDKNSNIFIVKDWGAPVIETETKVFYLKYATVSSSSLETEKSNYLTSETSSGDSASGSSENTIEQEKEAGITKIIRKILSSNGSVLEDYRTNSLIVTDVPSRMAVVTQTIAALDVPVSQVMLEVEMLDVNKNITERLGIKYGTTPFTAILTGGSIATGYPFGSWGKTFFSDTTSRGSLAINSGTNTYQATMDFIKTQADTKFLARPKLLTLNNQTAEIKITKQESIGVTTTTEATSGTTSATPERSETGISLRVTPQINPETGEITMFIFPRVGEASTGGSFTSDGKSFQFRDPEERSTKSIVRIKDGDTVIIGGLIRNKNSNTITKMPFLGDIPLLGGLFRHKNNDENSERELLVFITPHIIKDSNSAIAQAKRIVLPEREQGIAVTPRVGRQTAISTSLSAFEKNK